MKKYVLTQEEMIEGEVIRKNHLTETFFREQAVSDQSVLFKQIIKPWEDKYSMVETTYDSTKKCFFAVPVDHDKCMKVVLTEVDVKATEEVFISKWITKSRESEDSAWIRDASRLYWSLSYVPKNYSQMSGVPLSKLEMLEMSKDYLELGIKGNSSYDKARRIVEESKNEQRYY